LGGGEVQKTLFNPLDKHEISRKDIKGAIENSGGNLKKWAQTKN